MFYSRETLSIVHVLSPKRRVVIALALGLLAAACTPPSLPTQAPANQQQESATTPEPVIERSPSLNSEPVVEQSVAALPPTDETALPPVETVRPEVKVGLLVPLSGKHKSEGRGLLDAAQLALFDASDERFTLLPVDTGGTANGAASAAARVIEAGASLVLGPLFGEEALAVAPVAQSRGINVVSFSNNPNAARDGVYLLGPLASQQISRLIGHAQASGLKRFAVLAPDDGYGRLVAGLTQEAVSRVGAVMGPVQFYPPTVGPEQISQIVRSLAESGPFDALVLPDAGIRLLRLLPVLAVQGLTAPRVKLLGTGLWDDRSLHTEPALLGGWYVSAQPEGRATFRQRFKAVYGYEPNRLASLGYDAAALAILLAQTPSGADFSAKSLLDQRGFFGTEGVFRFSPNGTSERGLAVIEIGAAGTLQIASPAPTRFPSSATAGGAAPESNSGQ